MDADEATDRIDDALTLLDEIEERYPSLYDRGSDFFDGVRGTLEGIRETIGGNDFPTATPDQAAAIDNITAGIKAWHPLHR